MQKYKHIIYTVLLINIVLVSTHEGEFWPFSIFPMFSQAGIPWSRGVVENVQDTTRADLWDSKPITAIDNRILPLEKHGIHSIDYANYISKTKDWNTKKINGLRSTFGIDNHPGQMWMATRVVGSINEQDSVVIQAIPMFLFTADSTYKNPRLFSE
ncbi:hypothetical protein [Fodinibius salsisoli]|uniref:Uncharacterized protein n=1 Tax=Fodinibius salsisoli TaxID=2820877 RepID=A0ABT3PN46_9BACT|nr:hypothetical protein [Fodinibius salsisoli]MCW9707360.1 hypothetical protein [Fodinibius salsisoli]